MNINALLETLKKRGVHFENKIEGVYSAKNFAMDASPAMFNKSNAGVPGWMTTYIDPKIIDILFAPTNATMIAPEQQVGSWTSTSAQFPVAETTGNVSAYGDYSGDGSTGVNFNWTAREPFHFQTFVRWGEKEVATAQEGNYNLVQEIEKAAITTITQAFDTIYFYGVAGLKNYGLLNDPSLKPAITPVDPALWAVKEPQLIYNDINALRAKLVEQTQGRVQDDSSMKLCLSPKLSEALNRANSYGLVAAKLVKDRYPNIQIVTSHVYSVGAVNTVQLIADQLNGINTVEMAYTEKMRSFPVIPASSSYHQKRSAGCWGAIIRQPVAIATMTGV